MPSPRGPEHLVIVVRPGRRTRTVLGWLRQLFPAAMLLVARANLDPSLLPIDADAQVITLDADWVGSGPLAIAHAIAKGRGG
jgi:hypothetical protein